MADAKQTIVTSLITNVTHLKNVGLSGVTCFAPAQKQDV